MYRALLCFSPSLSKRLIAKGICAMPQVQRALKEDRILISTGTTTAGIYTELTGASPDQALACGMVTSKGLCVGRGMTRFLGKHGHAKFWYLEQGRLVHAENLGETLAPFTSKDIFMKGANALDSRGRAGILLGMEDGGIMGKAMGHVMAKGVHFLIPVGLEKTIYGSVMEQAGEMGTRKLDYSSGMPVGLVPVSGQVVTEMEAIRELACVTVFHVASGGISGGEGSVTLLIKGEKGEVEKIVQLYGELKANDPPVMAAEPALCHEHKWPPCAKRNIFFEENVRNKR